MRTRIVALLAAALGGALFLASCGDDIHMIRVQPELVSLTNRGDTIQLHSMGLDRTEVPVKVDGAFAYISKNPDVATVSADGLVTAVGNGQANIMATYGKAFGEAIIQVCLPREIIIEPKELELPIGGVRTVKTKLLDCQGKPIATPPTKYRVSDPVKVQVNDTGELIGLEAGDVVLTVESKGMMAEAKITIPPIPEELLAKMRKERGLSGGGGWRGGSGEAEPSRAESNISHLLKGWNFGADGKAKVE